MITTTTWGRIAPAASHPGPVRAFSVAGATLAAVAVWAIAVPGQGTHLLIRFGDGSPQTVPVGLVVGAALAASPCGWAALTVLERRTHRARAIWTAVAVAVTVASLSLPIIGGISTATATARPDAPVRRGRPHPRAAPQRRQAGDES